jgi:hypothetical protein
MLWSWCDLCQDKQSVLGLLTQGRAPPSGRPVCRTRRGGPCRTAPPGCRLLVRRHRDPEAHRFRLTGGSHPQAANADRSTSGCRRSWPTFGRQHADATTPAQRPLGSLRSRGGLSPCQDAPPRQGLPTLAGPLPMHSGQNGEDRPITDPSFDRASPCPEQPERTAFRRLSA